MDHCGRPVSSATMLSLGEGKSNPLPSGLDRVPVAPLTESGQVLWRGVSADA